MSLRARLLVAFTLVVFVPLALLALGFRYEVTRRLDEVYQRQLGIVARTVQDDLRRESATLQQQLSLLSGALADDYRVRAALAGVPGERQYLLEWAGSTMRLTGMSLLQVVDEQGEIISSGHFRNEHGRVVPDLLASLDRVSAGARPGDEGGRGVVLLQEPGAGRDVLVLARHARLQIGARELTLVGGIALDERLLDRLTSDREVTVVVRSGATVLAGGRAANAGATSGSGAAGDDDRSSSELRLPLLLVTPDGRVDEQDATLEIGQERSYLDALLRRIDGWFLSTAAVATILALALALWLSSRVTRRLTALADKTAVLDLDRLDVEFDEGTDEVGRLSRVLGELTGRLRTGTARVREAERRATIGDLSRQVNHDIKNGLIPLRNVMRHLAQVGRDDPATVASVLNERRQTIDSSIGYLETLATNYERLSTVPQVRDCDVHELIEEVAAAAGSGSHAEIRTELSATEATVFGDPVAVRRILENLVTNAVDSLDGHPGRVTITTGTLPADDGPQLRIVIADTGRGMSAEQASRIFEHFYTTKPSGGGLGLSIVRRLVTDLRGTVRVESEMEKGTRMIVDVPVSRRNPQPVEPAAASRQGGRRRW